MSKKRDQIINILRRYSGRSMPIPRVSDIQRLHRHEYGNVPSKHTIIDAIESLRNLGLCTYNESVDSQGRQIRTNIAYRHSLEPFEARFFADQVSTLAYIPEKDRMKMISRLRDVADADGRDGFDKFTGAQILEDNLSTQFFETVEKLYVAIYVDRACVAFALDRTQYEWQKTGEELREYSPVHPLTMAFHDGFYYLYCHIGESARIYSFRIDLIRNVRILEKKKAVRVSEDRIAKARLSPFAGDLEKVVVRFLPDYTTYVLDHFGYDCAIRDAKKKGWKQIEAQAITEGLEYWAIAFLGRVEILSPKDVRDRIRKIIAGNPY